MMPMEMMFNYDTDPEDEEEIRRKKRARTVRILRWTSFIMWLVGVGASMYIMMQGAAIAEGKIAVKVLTPEEISGCLTIICGVLLFVAVSYCYLMMIPDDDDGSERKKDRKKE